MGGTTRWRGSCAAEGGGLFAGRAPRHCRNGPSVEIGEHSLGYLNAGFRRVGASVLGVSIPRQTRRGRFAPRVTEVDSSRSRQRPLERNAINVDLADQCVRNVK